MEKKSDLLRLLIGWREWVSLPDLGIPHIKAKVDTGARTSSLHAFNIRTTTERGSPIVHFSVHPIQGRNDIIIECKGPLIDHRVVSDSGGHRERRYVTEVTLSIGGLDWPIEITLANRETMSFRMLLGRSAMKYLQIEPTKNYLLGRPKSPIKAYKKHRKPR